MAVATLDPICSSWECLLHRQPLAPVLMNEASLALLQRAEKGGYR